MHCFKIKVLYRFRDAEAEKTVVRDEWQTKFVWLSKGADSKIRVVGESGEGP
jgi:hypothetical protein